MHWLASLTMSQVSNHRSELSGSFQGAGAAGYGWNFGLGTADAAGVVLGTATTLTGGIVAGGGGLLTAGSGGAASPVSLPIVGAGVVVGTIGLNTTINSAKNLVNHNGRVNASSNSSGNGVRSKNKLDDHGGPPNSSLSNKPGTTIKKYNKDGEVVKEWNKGHPDHPKSSKNYKDHVHDYMKPGDKRTRQPARTPKRNEKLKDFNN